MIDSILKKNNIKVTNQRKKVLSSIIELNDSSTIHNILKFNSDLTKSTIYRIIECFLENNIIEKELNVNDEVYYSLKSEHIHYLTCIKCHNRQRVNICPLEINDLNGFIITSHKLEISGICKNCQG